MNRCKKILSKILANRIQQHIKNIHKAGRVAQVVECLPSKCEAVSSNPSTAKKNHIPWLNWFHSRDVRMVQHTQITKCNTAHKQSKRQKPHDPLNSIRKSHWQNSTSFHDSLKKQWIEGMYLNIIQVIYDKTIANWNHFL
jgi:hypothetical protein